MQPLVFGRTAGVGSTPLGTGVPGTNGGVAVGTAVGGRVAVRVGVAGTGVGVGVLDTGVAVGTLVAAGSTNTGDPIGLALAIAAACEITSVGAAADADATAVSAVREPHAVESTHPMTKIARDEMRRSITALNAGGRPRGIG